MRRLALLVLGAVLVAAVLRRRTPTRYVDVEFEDGSVLRLARGPEARDLMDDANTILDVA